MKGETDISLSEDHKPNLPNERDRIYKANSFVANQRVNGNLATSRSLGDFSFKDNTNLPLELQAVTAYPDVGHLSRSQHDKFIILACDGIWDCLSSQECCQELDYKIERLGQQFKKDQLAKPVE